MLETPLKEPVSLEYYPMKNSFKLKEVAIETSVFIRI